MASTFSHAHRRRNEDPRLLRDNPHPTEQEVREGLEGNLCRCTGYQNIVRAVLRAAGESGPAATGGLASTVVPSGNMASEGASS